MQVERSYDPAAASNVAFSAALNVRYTFTLGQ
jgi:hypothetical protein